MSVPRGVFAIALVAIALSLLLPVGSASADPTFVDGPPDKGKHTWCYLSVFTMKTQADASMTRLRNQTVVDTAYYNPCTASTDVRWRQGSISGGAFGMAECKVWASSGRCDRYHVTLNKAAIDGTSHPTSQGHKTACHELGHTAGVSHYSGSNLPGSDTATAACARRRSPVRAGTPHMATITRVAISTHGSAERGLQMTGQANTKLAAGAVASLLVFTVGGCASTTGTTPEASSPSPTKQVVAPQRPVVDAAVVRGSADYDYEPFASITSASEVAEAGTVGEVVSWSEGRALSDGDEVDYSAVLKVRIVDALKPDGLSGDIMYVEVRRGGEVMVDGKPFRHEGARAAYRTIEDLDKAVPAGTRVIVLGLIAPSDKTLETESVTGHVVHSGAGLPAGAALVSPYPQGLLFETASGGFASGYADGETEWGWLPDITPPDRGFATLVQQVTERG